MSVTPVYLDGFSREMLAGFDESSIITAPTAFQSFFGRAETNSQTVFAPNSEVFDIEIIRDNETIAPLIQRGSIGSSLSPVTVTRNGEFSNFSRVFPLIELEVAITADEVNKRIFGESPYQQLSKSQRRMALAMRIHSKNVRKIIGTMEWMASQAIITGKMPTLLGTANSDLIYDYRRHADLIFAAPAVWDAGTPDILGDLDEACDRVRIRGKVMPDAVFMNGATMSAVINDTTVKSIADNRGYTLVRFGEGALMPAKYQKFIDNGWEAFGVITTPANRKLHIFTISDSYQSLAGVTTKWLADGTVIVMNTSARMDRAYGPGEANEMTASRIAWFQEQFGFSPASSMQGVSVKDASRVVMPEMFMVDGFAGSDQKSVTIRTQSAPVFVTTQTDEICTITGALTP